MKRLRYIVLLCTLHLALCTLSAQTYHAFVGDLQGGFSGKAIGGNAATHVGYGLRHRHLIFRLGAGVGYDYLQTPMPDSHLANRAVDTERFEYLRSQDYTQRTDRSHSLEVQVPVLLGAEWKYFYFLLGATPSCRIYSLAQTTAMVTTIGDYDMFYGPFVDMPNHGFTTLPYTSDLLALPMAWNIYASAEIGVPLGEYLRLGAFADYAAYTTDIAPYRVGLRLSVWVGREQEKRPAHKDYKVRPNRYHCKCLNEQHIFYHYDTY